MAEFLLFISLDENKVFWKTLFEESGLVKNLMGKDGSTPFDEFKFDISSFGKVSLTVKPAVPIGTNFLSDVFIAKAVLENGKTCSSFVKVLIVGHNFIHHYLNLITKFNCEGSSI